MSISPGETVGPYRVIEQLGSGGMATVFKAYHPALDRYVAIKILHPAFKADPQFFERFKREARIVANLEHPNIIPVYDFNEHNGEPYLVMRYVEGDTLKAHMDTEPTPSDKVLRLMRPVCLALAYAHNQGVLHRDIKPSNVMITRDGSVFLSDFGLARMVQAGESTLSQDMMVGTPQYISPEQAQGMSKLDGRTDIYSLGVVLFEMLTGRVPFSADTPFATIHDHIYSPLPLPSTINPDIDPAVERMLLKALAKEPNDRYANADELLHALESTLGAQTISKPAIEPTALAKKRSGVPWWVWAGSAALIVCLVGAILGGVFAYRRSNRVAQSNNQAAATPVVGDNQPALPLPTSDAAAEPAVAETDEPLPQPTPTSEKPAAGGEDAAALTREATQALRDGKLDKAIELYEQAIETDPHHLPAYFGLSEALKQNGDEEGSMATLKTAVENNPEEAAAWLRLGDAQLFTTQNPAAALASFEKAAALEPHSPEPYAGQALALVLLDEDERAKKAIDEALAIDAASPAAHLANAVYLNKQGNRREALQEVRMVLRNQATPLFVRQRAQQLLEHLSK
jgi:serine/threonine-protein kinase